MAEASWVIPAISAGASLLGTLVGGFSTYSTSKKSFERSAARELALATAPHIQRQATDSLNHEINEFFNRVRHHMNVEDIEFDLFNQEVAQHVLKLS